MGQRLEREFPTVKSRIVLLIQACLCLSIFYSYIAIAPKNPPTFIVLPIVAIVLWLNKLEGRLKKKLSMPVAPGQPVRPRITRLHWVGMVLGFFSTSVILAASYVVLFSDASLNLKGVMFWAFFIVMIIDQVVNAFIDKAYSYIFLELTESNISSEAKDISV